MARWLAIALAAALVIGTAPRVDAAADSEAYRRGAEALSARDYPAAIEWLERAVAAEPDAVDGWFKLGLARSAAGDGQGAATAYARVVDLDPGHAKALNNLANVHFRQGRYEEAAEWYRRAIEVDPDYLLATYHYGWVERHFNHTEQAERLFGRCLELQARNDRERATQVDCLFFLGALRFRAGDHARAAELMERVLSFNRGHVEARYYLGMAYRHLGRLDDARTQLEIHRKMLRAARGSEPIEKQDDP